MKTKPTLLLIFAIVFLWGCGADKKNQEADVSRTDTTQLDSTRIANEPNEQFKSILDYCASIDSITNWTSVISKDLHESTEGGEAKYYFLNGQLQKISVRQFGETFQQHLEYYVSNQELCCVSERLYRYNRPMNYDSKTMTENGDVESFDLEKSEIFERRTYFENKKIVQQTLSPEKDSPFAESTDNQNQFQSNFNNLLKLISSK